MPMWFFSFYSQLRHRKWSFYQNLVWNYKSYLPEWHKSHFVRKLTNVAKWCKVRNVTLCLVFSMLYHCAVEESWKGFLWRSVTVINLLIHWEEFLLYFYFLERVIVLKKALENLHRWTLRGQVVLVIGRFVLLSWDVVCLCSALWPR